MKPCLPNESAEPLMVSSESAMTPLRKCKNCETITPEKLDG